MGCPAAYQKAGQEGWHTCYQPEGHSGKHACVHAPFPTAGPSHYRLIEKGQRKYVPASLFAVPEE